jgi:hypothetical protein
MAEFLLANPPREIDSAQRPTRGAAAAIGVGLSMSLLAVPADAIVQNEFRTLEVMRLETRNALRVRFRTLAARWVKETTTSSSSFQDIVINSAYQGIIGLGPQAVPLILEELQRAPDHWGWALEAITGENPVPPEAAGDVDAIARAWLRWGRAQKAC